MRSLPMTLTALFLAAPVVEAQSSGAADTTMVRTTRAPAPVNADAIRIDDRPALVLGGRSGEGPHELWQVASAYRDAGGGTVVSVAGAHELRRFDDGGAAVASYGRRGGGPREFHDYASMELYVRPDERLAVDDRFNGRMHLVDTRLSEADLLQLRPLPGFGGGTPRGSFADGSWLAVAPQNEGRPTGRGRVRHFVLAYHRVDPDWTRSAELVRVATRPRVSVESGGRPRLFPVPFTVDPIVVPAGDETLVILAGEAEIRRYDETGALRGIHRWSSPSRQARDHWTRYQRHTLDAAAPERRPALARMHTANLPLPSILPHVQRLIVDATGSWWAERYRLPWESRSAWDVIAPDGRWIATVRTPPGLEVQQVGRDFVIGVVRDEFDVESVVMHRLHRGAEG